MKLCSYSMLKIYKYHRKFLVIIIFRTKKVNIELIALVVMPGDRCIVCRSSRAKDPDASFHRFPSDLSKKQLWIEEFGLIEGSVKTFNRVCSRHFRNGDPANGPDKTLGARFASPKKRGTSSLKRATKRALSFNCRPCIRYSHH